MNRSFLFFITLCLASGTYAYVGAMQSEQHFIVKVPLQSHPNSQGALTFNRPFSLGALDLFDSQIENRSLLGLIALFTHILNLNKEQYVHRESEMLSTLVQVFFEALILKLKSWSSLLENFFTTYSSSRYYQTSLNSISGDLVRNNNKLCASINQFFSKSHKTSYSTAGLIAVVFDFLEHIPSFFLLFHSHELKELLSKEYELIQNLLKAHYQITYNDGFPYIQNIDLVHFQVIEEQFLALSHHEEKQETLPVDDLEILIFGAIDQPVSQVEEPISIPELVPLGSAASIPAQILKSDAKSSDASELAKETTVDKKTLDVSHETKHTDTHDRPPLEYEGSSKKRKTSLAGEGELSFSIKLMLLELSELVSEIDETVNKEELQKNLVEHLTRQQFDCLHKFLKQNKDTLDPKVIKFVENRLCHAHQEQKDLFFEVISQEEVSFPLLLDIIDSFFHS